MAHEQPLPAVVLARDFFTLQEERVRQYAALSASHREYLSTAPSYDIETYQRAVADATKNFKEISERIIEMRTQFDEEFREKVQTRMNTSLSSNSILFFLGALQLCRQNPTFGRAEAPADGRPPAGRATGA